MLQVEVDLQTISALQFLPAGPLLPLSPQKVASQ